MVGTAHLRMGLACNGFSDRPTQRRVASRAGWLQTALRDEFVDVGGHQVLAAGRGGVHVLFVPTFVELTFVYSDLIDTLSVDHRVLTYIPKVTDRSFFGPVERAREALSVMDELGVPAAHVVAWSDAGSVLTELAVLAPGRVLSAVYLGTPGAYRLSGPLDLLARLYTVMPLDRVTLDQVAATAVAWFLGGRLLTSRDLLPRVRALGNVAGYLRFSILPCLMYSSVERIQASTAVSRGSMPVLVVGGRSDRLVGPDEQMELAAAWGGTFVCLENGDHFMPFTSAHDVSQAVTEFLRSPPVLCRLPLP